jgi:DNA-binding transcriptional LysR family regulator
MDWSTCLKTFATVVEAQSFSKAATYLHTTNSAITKRIQWLEHDIGATLLQRTTRQLHMTEAGEMLYQRSAPLLREWEDVKQAITVSQKTPQGLLRIATTPQFAKLFITDIIADFFQEYPGFSVDLVDTMQAVNLMEQQIDVFIGMEPLVQDIATTVGKPLGQIDRECFATPTFLEKNPSLKLPKDLINHNCLIHANNKSWELDGIKYRVKSNFSANQAESFVVAATHHLGVIYLPRMMLKPQLMAKQLVPVFPGLKSKPVPIYAFYPKLPYFPRKVCLFLDYVKEHVKNSQLG